MADNSRSHLESDAKTQVSPEALSDFFENANVGIHLVGRDGTILHANKAELDLLGYDRDEYVGRHISEFYVDAAVIADILLRLAQRQQLRQYPAQLLCKNKSIKDVLIYSSVRWDEGQFIHTRCFTLDVTAAKGDDTSPALLASIVASSDDAIISTTLDGRITSWNRAAHQIFGYSAAEAIGESILLIIPKERHKEEEEILRRLRQGETIHHFETLRKAKAGNVVEISLTVSPIRNRDGMIVGVSKIGRDISARKQAEARANAAKSALEEADRRKSEFLAILAHELRNPLAPLRNAMEIVKQSPLDHSRVTLASNMMDRQLSHIERLVEDLLDVSRINQNRLLLRLQQLDLVPLINSVMEGFQPIFEASKQQLEIDVPTQPINVKADPVRLSQVFSNLVTNAAKYTPMNGQISIVAKEESGWATVSIKDSGIGIRPDRLEDIFEMFAQAPCPDTATQTGLGIGLTLARQLMQMHGGTVHALSAGLNQGSEFVVRMPLSDQSNPPLLFTNEKPESELRKRRVLIADDNTDAAESLGILLTMAGHEVKVAFDGSEAVAVAEKFSPHVAFVDLGMPVLDGLQTAKKIRNAPWGRDMVLVALTGWGQESDRQRCKAAGFNDHLTKPATPEDVIRIISRSPDGS
jgi:PAS domain S-box-containing protein